MVPTHRICHSSHDLMTLLPECQQANLFKTERDKVTRALAKEVGDDTPISKVVEGGSDWRGRAQQITLLKAKISDLQQAQVMVTVFIQHFLACFFAATHQYTALCAGDGDCAYSA